MCCFLFVKTLHKTNFVVINWRVQVSKESSSNNPQVKMCSRTGCFQELNTLYYTGREDFPTPIFTMPDTGERYQQQTCKDSRSKRHCSVCDLRALPVSEIHPSRILLLVGWHLKLQLPPDAPLAWPPTRHLH